ncbi:hypothetical protein JCM15754A_19250 [Prevotella aurantiaca JCM 15754]|jgi:hypothetical protein|uniref:hypothetical protein n=1 Tax=Prevotella aurantiaca TaxID=596085 RepID=UPI00046A9545|nr:hypothetical protein [Prevotella aurantiaca]
MDTIDITYELEAFYHHLNEATIDRTIFSARFGDGKTEFLKQFKEKYQNEYDFYTLYPVNYQIAPNEQIMEYIKRDLLFQLILNNKIEQGIEIPDSIAFQWYLCNNSFDIIRKCMKFAPSLIGTMSQYQEVLVGVTVLAETIIKQYQKFKDYEKEINNDESKKALDFVEKFNNKVGGIYELDPISWLIAKSITDENGKTSVLIIEDLDRIEPAHLFRILNIFSAHIDRQYLLSDQVITEDGKEKSIDELQNKFGFKKIIFVMDAEATKAIYEKFYGNYNYNGYISKFISKRIFEYSITETARRRLSEHIYHECGIDRETMFEALTDEIKILGLSVRDIVRVLDGFTNSYRKEVVKITDDVQFLSDTPLVKILAILSRLGVKRNNMPKVIQKIKPNEEIIRLLSSFALDKSFITKANYIRYNGQPYYIQFNIDGNKKLIVDNILSISNKMVGVIQCTEIDFESIINKALKYVN